MAVLIQLSTQPDESHAVRFPPAPPPPPPPPPPLVPGSRAVAFNLYIDIAKESRGFQRSSMGDLINVDTKHSSIRLNEELQKDMSPNEIPAMYNVLPIYSLQVQ
ncbi:hypothetical protein N7541_009938 [Penicillium brevicompactum]|uniref:Uncharacterized protein n=1 Tax=Penicillium brevicompactum TaxID=5074 RepID=A0A9W9QQN0_PENBR|nr:hypothetical protein N7541_009938 [Penicillium brevicompactum]